MAKLSCDFRYLLIPAAFVFIYIQMRLFTTQSEYADRMAEAVDAEHHCTSQMRLLIDQISMQQEQIVALEEGKKRKDQECAQLKTLVNDLEVPVAAVVIMACNRADYLERTVASVLKYQSSVASKYPLFVSQDGSDPRVKTKALSYKELTYMQHIDYDPVHTDRPGELIAYYKIARHYKWALDELFYKHNFDRVIILESIMAVSSWNDNGQKQFVYDPYALYRSDFFPGLGWMLTRSTLSILSFLVVSEKALQRVIDKTQSRLKTDDMEIAPDFFDYFEAAAALLDKDFTYWDDWLRLKENHKGRQFLRPEVCRTYNFGEHGSSMGQFFEKYLAPIKMNDVKVDWKSQDLSYLTEDKYAQYFADILKMAKPIPGTDPALMASNIEGDIRIQYRDQSDFEYIAQQFGVFEEWKDGVPRTAYKGVVVFRYHPPRRVFLVGPDSLQQLGIENA
ncbi:hypothetical protein GOBAR_DD32846 [Gossypium barbadense]|nr:hypothetical protein GOBAR_DD32846 [Gossypium barbadense]